MDIKEEQLTQSLEKMQVLMNNTANLKNLSLDSTLRDAVRRSNDLGREMADIAKENDKRHQAVLDTANTLKSIDGKVESIDSGLSNERTERINSDQENMRYTQKWNKINLLVAVIGALAGLAGLIIAIIK